MIQLMTDKRMDCHSHTITYSDGFNSVDEMVIWAGNAGLRELVITDHCQYYLDRCNYGKKTNRNLANHYRNMHNSVIVRFGIEGDIMNEQGDVSMDIQGYPADFLILSAHRNVFDGDPKKITEAYLRSIERFHGKIAFLGHLCSKYFDTFLDVDQVIDAALAHDVGFELDCANLFKKRTNLDNLKKMLSRAQKLWVNSDAHTIEELLTLRDTGYKYLRENGYIQ